MSPMSRAILMVARWGAERIAREQQMATDADKLAGIAASAAEGSAPLTQGEHVWDYEPKAIEGKGDDQTPVGH